jgi:outer membrane receptor protein involved in Fe transport
VTLSLQAGLTLAPAIALAEPAEQELQQIVVTARKREEKLLEVPIAVTAVSGSELARRGFTTINDLAQIVPGVQVASSEGKEQVNVTIRGIGMANQFSANAATPVGVFTDGVYQSFLPSPGVQQFDLERVEVLRGPQGTLFGHNTTAGSINFVSVTPKLDGRANGYATLGYGNFNHVLGEAASDVTLINDELGFRVSAQYERADGFEPNLLGEDGGAENSVHGRIQLRAKPSDDLDMVLKVYGGQNRGTNPRLGIGTLAPGDRNSAGYSRLALPSRWSIDTSLPIPLHTSQAGVGLNVKWFKDAFTITSISQYDHGTNFSQIDCDTSPADLCQTAYDLSGNQASQDLRLNYDNDNLHAVVGVYYGWDRINFSQLTHFNDGALFDIRNTYLQTRNTEAAYNEVTYDITSAWSATAGLRYTFDQNELAKVQTALTDGYGGPPIVTTVPGGPYSPTAFLPTKHGDTDGLTARAIVQYKFAESKLAYVSFSHGYRAGNFNGSEFFSPAEANFVAPEKINTYELGVKGQFLDRRLTLATAAFFNDLKDQQVATQILNQGTFEPGLGSLNGHSYGLELEAQVQVLETLRLTGNMSMLRSRYDDNQVINGTIPVGGAKFPFAPDYTALFQFAWTAWHSGDQSVVLLGSANYMGRFYYDPQNGLGGAGSTFVHGQSPYTLIDARLTYNIANLAISAWGRNLTDKLYLPYNANAGDFDAAAPGMPRTYGVEFKVSF